MHKIRTPGGRAVARWIWICIVYSTLGIGLFASGPGCGGGCGGGGPRLLNVSYDPTRELFEELNPVFVALWKEKTGQKVAIRQSHGGSGKQARGIIDGLPGDVVSLAIASDVDRIVDAGLIDADWRTQLDNHASAFHSTVVFLVRAGNPKGIRDWSDLGRSDVQIITPNPKTSGAARLGYLAAWHWALREFAGDEQKVRAWMRDFYRRVPVLDTGARGASTTFVERGMGDVLVTWENEAILALAERKDAKLELVAPPTSVLAEPPLAVVRRNASRKGTEELAKAYLEFLYTEPAQIAAAKHGYRPTMLGAEKKAGVSFAPIQFFRVEDTFGPWKQVEKLHFSEKGEFDKLFMDEGVQ